MSSPLKPGEVVPSDTYIERGTRWMEKEESYSVRRAMEDMSIKDEPKDDEEQRIHEAALNEASELVWRHQNGVKPPAPGAPYQYKAHMRKNSYAHARTASTGRYGDDIQPSGLVRDPSYRSFSGSSSSSDGNGGSRRARHSMGSTPAESGRPSLEVHKEASNESMHTKPYNGLAGGPRPMTFKSGRRKSSLKRNISGEVATPFSGDQIYEEPDTSKGGNPLVSADVSEEVRPLALKAKNPTNRVSFVPESSKSPTAPQSSISKLVNRYEIHRNPPSQSRNPAYVTNAPTPKPVEPESEVPKKNGVELRGDDIREATSMKLKDRSAKLPTPSYVSDTPGRPIVSFDANWKAPEEATDQKPDPRKSPFTGRNPIPQPSQAPAIPTIAVTEDVRPAASSPRRQQPTHAVPSIQVDAPAVPSIAVSAPIPSISVTGSQPPIPSIVLPDQHDDGPSIPVIVTPDDNPSIPVIVTPDQPSISTNGSPSKRPLPSPSTTPRSRVAARPRSHWSPAPAPVGNRATALCHECRHPIEGRFVALAGGRERFHPQCFSCYTCGTSLEALEISPEPEPDRNARLERIHRRAAGELLPEEPGQTMAEDGDERLRFYCHLDWHELFAPRCKHCSTPILGEHIVALGQHWHYGHFFCAECGDPFGEGMTHIEKDGYAWCINCQTKRTERRAPKCKACKKAVIGQYVMALGGEWHDECFRCAVCQGGFEDGQIFPRESKGGQMQIVCTPCRERELKA